MGIPHLWTLLEAYGTRQVFQSQGVKAAAGQSRTSSPQTWASKLAAQPLLANWRGQKSNHSPSSDTAANTPRFAVIDGPSLAFWVYGNVVASRRAQKSLLADNGISIIPSYKETNDELLTWLETLGTYGFEVGAIYFDGALPQSKRGERLSRLQGSINKLVSYRRVTPPPGTQFKAASQLSSNSGIVPPFLVPAAIECLRSSSFADRVHLVPGEADVFCAARLQREGGGYVFSSDSDLLVYNLGVDSHVVSFHGSDNWQKNDQNLSLTSFCPQTIAKSLGLDSLQSLAFAILQDTHASLSAGIGRAKLFEKGIFAAPSKRDVYELFKGQYTANVSLLHADVNSKVPIEKSDLDPRISEWVVQQAAQSAEQSTEAIYVYLPSLLEDPSQSAAWTGGSLIRQLAYSCYSTDKDRQPATIEIYRKGESSSATELPQLPADQRERHCKAWIDTFRMFGISSEAGITIIVKAALWRAIALTVVLRQLIEEGKDFPPRSTIDALLKGHTLFIEWYALHLSAKMQAVLYSFRALRQILQASFEMEQSNDARKPTGRVKDTLHQQLSQLPSLTDLHSPQGSLLSENACNRLIGLIARALGIEVSAFDEAPRPAKKRKKI